MKNDLKIIDFHSHILPCVDHGSDGITTSVKQVTLMNNAGVNTVVLTPHFYPNLNRVSDFTSEINAAAEELISKCDMRPRFCIGAEVLYCDGIEEMEDLSKLCIRGTNVLMLELPVSYDWDRTMIYAIRRLASTYTVILAHIDRYVGVHDNALEVLLSDDNIVGQINASALFHKKTRRSLLPYINAGYVFAVGSDIHGNDKKNYRRFKNAAKILGTENYAEIMLRSAALLKNASLL